MDNYRGNRSVLWLKYQQDNILDIVNQVVHGILQFHF